MFRLPVSGLRVALRQPTGAEDLLLAEAADCDAGLALALLSRVTRRHDGEELACEELTATDVDALLLLLRRAVLGDLIRADMNCPAEGCGERVGLAFLTSDYLAHHRPRAARGAERADEEGWFRLKGTDVTFRPPSGADRLAVEDHPDPGRELMRRCVRPAEIPARLVGRVESALEALAPSLADNVRGSCPECGVTIEAFFVPQQYSLRELRAQAAYVYEEIDLIARHYHWSEAEIIALPRHRRARYAELIRERQGQP